MIDDEFNKVEIHNEDHLNEPFNMTQKEETHSYKEQINQLENNDSNNTINDNRNKNVLRGDNKSDKKLVHHLKASSIITSASVVAACVIAVPVVASSAGLNIVSQSNARAVIEYFYAENSFIEYGISLYDTNNTEYVIVFSNSNYYYQEPLKEGENHGFIEHMVNGENNRVVIKENNASNHTILDYGFTMKNHEEPIEPYLGIEIDPNIYEESEGFNVYLYYEGEVAQFNELAFTLFEEDSQLSYTYPLSLTYQAQFISFNPTEDISFNPYSGTYRYELSYMFEQERYLAASGEIIFNFEKQPMEEPFINVLINNEIDAEAEGFMVRIEADTDMGEYKDVIFTLSNLDQSIIYEYPIEILNEDTYISFYPNDNIHFNPYDESLFYSTSYWFNNEQYIGPSSEISFVVIEQPRFDGFEINPEADFIANEIYLTLYYTDPKEYINNFVLHLAEANENNDEMNFIEIDLLKTTGLQGVSILDEKYEPLLNIIDNEIECYLSYYFEGEYLETEPTHIRLYDEDYGPTVYGATLLEEANYATNEIYVILDYVDVAQKINAFVLYLEPLQSEEVLSTVIMLDSITEKQTINTLDNGLELANVEYKYSISYYLDNEQYEITSGTILFIDINQ